MPPSTLALHRRMRGALVAAGDRLIEIDHRAGHQPRFGAAQEGAGAGDLVRLDEASEGLLGGGLLEPAVGGAVDGRA